MYNLVYNIVCNVVCNVVYKVLCNIVYKIVYNSVYNIVYNIEYKIVYNIVCNIVKPYCIQCCIYFYRRTPHEYSLEISRLVIWLKIAGQLANSNAGINTCSRQGSTLAICRGKPLRSAMQGSTLAICRDQRWQYAEINSCDR